MSQKSSIIIGAGPAGLTTAYELGKRGVTSTVLEASDQVGGISKTVNYRGYRFDIGGHRFFSKVPLINELWHEILGEEFLLRPRISRIYYNQHFFDYPLKPLNALAGMAAAWREPGQVLLRYLSVAPLLLTVPVATLGSWWGGHGYGPRLLADSVPFLCYLMGPALDRIGQRAWMKYVVVGLAGVSVGMHAIGFAYSGDWGSSQLDFDTYPERVWYWRESPPVLFGTQFLEQAWQRVTMRF